MAGFNLMQRWQRMNNGQPPVSASDVADLVDTAQGLVQLSTINDITQTGAGKLAYGTGALVTGSVTIATGLATVRAFVATIQGATGFASGATEVSALEVSSITTGAVVVRGIFNSFVTGAATLSSSGTVSFNWIAFGT